jgi:hypothetical protein
MTALRVVVTVAVIAIAIALMIMAATAGNAQGAQCWPREALLGHLADTYGETLRGMGLTAADQVLEVYAAEVTGTWTIVVTRPDGLACMVASGEAYEAVDGVLPPAGTEG